MEVPPEERSVVAECGSETTGSNDELAGIAQEYQSTKKGRCRQCWEQSRYYLVLTVVIVLLIILPVLSFFWEPAHLRTPEVVWGVSLGSYGLFILFHSLWQIIASYGNRRWTRSLLTADDPERGLSALEKETVLSIVGFEESPDLFRDCLRSFARAGQGLKRIYICIDGHESEPNREMARIAQEVFPQALFLYLDRPFDEFDEGDRDPILQQIRLSTASVIITAKPHRHKRDAILTNVLLAMADHPRYMILTDSDTITRADNLTTLIRTAHGYESRETHPQLGGIAGDIQIAHPQTMLQRLLVFRYWFAFNLERAGQGYYRSVSCIGGPNGLYLYQALLGIIDDWKNQTFLGQRCTYGDDRHLTNLLLKSEYDILYQPHARVTTHAPPTFLAWISQQIRWTKSGIREFGVTQTFAHVRPTYFIFDLLVHFGYAIAVTVFMCYLLLFGRLRLWLLFVTLVNAVSIIRSGYGVLMNRDLSFLGFSLYGLLYLLVILPLRVEAFLTLRLTGWGTSHLTRYLSKNVIESLPVLAWTLLVFGRGIQVGISEPWTTGDLYLTLGNGGWLGLALSWLAWYPLSSL